MKSTKNSAILPSKTKPENSNNHIYSELLESFKQGNAPTKIFLDPGISTVSYILF
jgi:hypothetical protein